MTTKQAQTLLTQVAEVVHGKVCLQVHKVELEVAVTAALIPLLIPQQVLLTKVAAEEEVKETDLRLLAAQV